MTAPLIDLKNVSYRIGGRTILHDITLSIEPSELLTLVGPNGAGKSTLLHLILGHLKPETGKILRRHPLAIAYVPQNFYTPPDLPVTVARFLKDLPQQEKIPTLKQLDIAHLLNSPLQNLSGGETQRLLLARAMLKKPDIIALDEPAAGIDPAALGNYYHIIRDYQTKQQCAIIMVSHDLHIVMASSDRVICLNGHICCAGRPHDIIEHPDFRALSGETDIQELGLYTHHHQHTHI